MTTIEEAKKLVMRLRMDKEDFEADVIQRMINETEKQQPINIVFDGPPGPEAGRFIEVETDDGKSINAGNGYSVKMGCGRFALRDCQVSEDLW